LLIGLGSVLLHIPLFSGANRIGICVLVEQWSADLRSRPPARTFTSFPSLLPLFSPISPAVPPRSVFCLLLKLCAWVSALDLSSWPIVLSARDSCACEPRLTWCAPVWWNYAHRPTCQEPKESHQHAEAHSPDSFSPTATPTQSPLVPLDLP
jgi:hypothetical protein